MLPNGIAGCEAVYRKRQRAGQWCRAALRGDIRHYAYCLPIDGTGRRDRLKVDRGSIHAHSGEAYLLSCARLIQSIVRQRECAVESAQGGGGKHHANRTRISCNQRRRSRTDCCAGIEIEVCARRKATQIQRRVADIGNRKCLRTAVGVQLGLWEAQRRGGRRHLPDTLVHPVGKIQAAGGILSDCHQKIHLGARRRAIVAAIAWRPSACKVVITPVAAFTLRTRP